MDIFLEIAGKQAIHKVGDTIVFRDEKTEQSVTVLRQNQDQRWVHDVEDEEGEVVETLIVDHIQVKGVRIDIVVSERSITLSSASELPLCSIEVLKGTAGGRSKSTDSEAGFGRRMSTKTGLLYMLISAFVLAAIAGILSLLFWKDSIPVTILIEPVPEFVEIDGDQRSYDQARFVLDVGQHDVKIEFEGYASIEERIKVDKEHARFEFELSPLPGKLLLDSNVDVLNILVGEDVISCKNGESIDLMAGEYELTFDAGEDWQSVTKSVEIMGLGQEQRIEIQLTRNWAWLDLQTVPSGAALLDAQTGEVMGATPAHLKLKPGSYRWDLQADRQYQGEQVAFEIRPDFDLNLGVIVFDLNPATLELSTTPSGATVLVDGVPAHGTTPLVVEMDANREVTVKVMKKGFAEDSFLVEGEPGDEFEHHIDLVALSGEVVIESLPEGAMVYQGKKFVGHTPLTLELPVDHYVFKLEKTGYGEVRFETNIRSELRVKKSFTLKRTSISPEEERAELIEISKNLPQVIELKNGMRMVRVPAQTFFMGSDPSEKNHQSNEVKQEVRLSLPFYVSLTEVTNDQFREFDPSHDSGNRDGVDLNSGDRPVVNISWEKAAEFCNWMSDESSIRSAYTEPSPGPIEGSKFLQSGFRLPTEAEFESMLRLDSGEAPYPWGEDPLPPVRAGNFADSGAKEVTPNVMTAYFDGFVITAPVASYQANSLGMHDLSGNAWEWCHDFYLPVIPIGTRVPVDPVGPELGQRHSIRGGSCLSHPQVTLRSAARKGEKSAKDDLSFRVVLPLRGAINIIQSNHE